MTLHHASDGGRTIASFDDYRRAVAALEHLEAGPPLEGLHLVLSDFGHARTVPESAMRREGKRVLAPAATAAVAMMIVGMVTGAVPATGASFALALAVVVAVAVTVVLFALLRGARHGVPVPSIRLVPARYEVRAADRSRRASAAEAALAAWWERGLDGEPRTVDHRRVLA